MDKVYCVLFNYGSSKTLIHKRVVPHTYTPIQSNDDLWIFPLQDQLSSPTLLPYTKLNSQNLTTIWLLMNTMCLLLIPRTFNMTSYLVLISLANVALHLITMQIKFVGLNILFTFVTLLNFSYSYYSSLLALFQTAFENGLFGDPTANFFATRIIDAKYKQVNMHNVAFDQNHLSLDQWCHLFKISSKHKKSFDGSIRLYPYKKVHIDLKPQAKPMYTDKLSRRSLTTWLNLVFLNHVEPLNGHPWPSLLQKRMAAFDKSLIYAHSIKQSFASNTPYLSSPTY